MYVMIYVLICLANEIGMYIDFNMHFQCEILRNKLCKGTRMVYFVQYPVSHRAEVCMGSLLRLAAHSETRKA